MSASLTPVPSSSRNAKRSSQLCQIEFIGGREIYASDSGFRIVAGKMVCQAGQPLFDPLKQMADLTIKGEFPKITMGITYRVEGEWRDDQKYGKQFAVVAIYTKQPATQEEEQSFLSRLINMPNGAIKQLQAAFGNQLFDKLPIITAEELSEVTKLTVERAAICVAKIQEYCGQEQVIAKLCNVVAGCRVPQKAIVAYAQLRGNNAVESLKENPWSLRRCAGVGFKIADCVYLKLGGDPLSTARAINAIEHVIQENESTWLPVPKCLALATTAMAPVGEATAEHITAGIEAGILSSSDHPIHHQVVTTSGRAETERMVARKLVGMSQAMEGSSWIQDSFRGSLKSILSPHQYDVIHEATAGRVGILCGGPGTGKTYTAGALIRELLKLRPASSIAVVAPTGKAAVRLTAALQSMGIEEVRAITIHSYVGVSGTSESTGELILKNDVSKNVEFLVIEEASMITIELLNALLRSVPDGCQVLFLGDTGQLPPIGHGAPLRDLIASGVLTVGRLTEVRRNSGAIVRVCSEIASRSQYQPSEVVWEAIGHNCHHIECNAETSRQIVERIFRQPPPGCDLNRDIQILSPTKLPDNPIGTPKLNEAIRKIVNPRHSEENGFAEGDKIYVTANSQLQEVSLDRDKRKWVDASGPIYVANGEFGTVIEEIQPHGSRYDGKSVIKNPAWIVLLECSGSHVLVTQRSIMDFGWATTIHKSQGSEWPYVVIISDQSCARLGSRQLHYTAISRARRLCLTLGSIETIANQLRKDAISHRLTMFVERLQSLVPHEDPTHGDVSS